MNQENWTPAPTFENWKGKGFGPRGEIKLPTCRDLVLVPGGADWVIRELDEKFPECCWKFASTSSIAQYHFTQASKPNGNFFHNSAPSKQPNPALPVFYATLPHFYSPTDFSVQPKYLDEFRRRMCEEMDNEYHNFWTSRMDRDHLVAGVACAILDGHRWVRARVLKVTGCENAFVEFVDFGISKVVSITALYRLKKRFGKVPPMALHCRMKDVYINDLDFHKVEEFQKLIFDCGNVVRVELAALDEPYVVNLYHPTTVGVNLGTMFYRSVHVEQKEATLPFRTEEPLEKQDSDPCSDFEEDEAINKVTSGAENEIEAKILVVRILAKAPKIFRAVHQDLFIGNIENAGCIFLHEKNQLERRSIMEERLEQMFHQEALNFLPVDWISSSTACLYIVKEEGKTRIRRASIETIESNCIELFLCDHGLWKRLSNEEVPKHLYALPEEFSHEPLLYVVSLTDRGRYPHPDFTTQLKELTRHSSQVKFQPKRGSKSVPIRGILSNDLHIDLVKEVEKRLETNRRQINSWAVCPFTPSPFHDLLIQFIDLSFIHRPHPPHSLTRGSLTVDFLPKHY